MGNQHTGAPVLKGGLLQRYQRGPRVRQHRHGPGAARSCSGTLRRRSGPLGAALEALGAVRGRSGQLGHASGLLGAARSLLEALGAARGSSGPLGAARSKQRCASRGGPAPLLSAPLRSSPLLSAPLLCAPRCPQHSQSCPSLRGRGAAACPPCRR